MREARRAQAFLVSIATSLLGGCREDGAVREASEGDVVGGRYIRFDAAARVRALSLAARDESPTREEVEAYLSGDKGTADLLADWSKGEALGKRVGRVFDDRFGVPDTPFVVDDAHVLVRNAQGAYEASDGTITCAPGGPSVETVSPWWLDSGTVSVCAALQCGPEALRCVPKETLPRIWEAVRGELAARARYVYTSNLGWMDLWAGEWAYGDRHLAFVYQFESRPFEGTPARPEATPEERRSLAAAVRAVPLSAKARFTPPAFLAQRSGVVTAPQFLKRHNNFRSRIRGLSQALLCEDVGPALNTSGVATFKNPDLSAFDLSHGTKPGCSGCHYGMDNLGSALLGWDDNGHRQWWWSPSQKGHAFGVDGEGPKFLMETWVERGPRFPQCMAKTVWSSFSGGRSFDALPERTREAFTSAARKGLKPLVDTVLASPDLVRVDPR